MKAKLFYQSYNSSLIKIILKLIIEFGNDFSFY